LERDRTVKDYLDLLDEGTGLLLVGGQTVNLWAERYRSKDPAISWMSQHAKNAQEAMELGHHEDTDWSNFFPIKLMQEHPVEAVRNFTKYQLKPNA